MKNKIFNYLSENNITSPEHVDRLIVSSFLTINNIEDTNNKFIAEYKIHKTGGLEYLHLKNILKIIHYHGESFNLETLVQLFEFVVSPADRVVNGAIYTPHNIREFIVTSTIGTQKDISSLKIADISCGCAAFLLDAALRLKSISGSSFKDIYKNNIYGMDIERYSAQRSKILLSLAAILHGEDQNFEFNIICANALNCDWSNYIHDFCGFDVIIGNPPYVCSRHLSLETKKILSSIDVCRSGHPDLYIPFFQIGIESLSLNGILGFITMNSFFKSLNCRELRKFFHYKQLSFRILDFGSEQVFKSRNTYTCICFIKNHRSDYVTYTSAKSKHLDIACTNEEQIAYSNLNHRNGWNLKQNNIIRKIESTGKPFGSLYKTSHGLATLKNDVYIFSPESSDDKYHYLIKGKVYKIEKSICKSVVNSNKLSKKLNIDDILEKLIFPYEGSPKPSLLDEEYFKATYPFAYQYLCDNKEVLSMRDKGARTYEKWYAFGRTQSITPQIHKLFFPKYSNTIPHYILNSDKNTYFYNGQAILADNTDDLLLIKKILMSKIFWFYITMTSKPYASNYYSLNGTYINNFGICELTPDERTFILHETNPVKLESFFEDKYDIKV